MLPRYVSQKPHVRSGAHPVLVRNDMQKRDFSTKLLEKLEVGSVLFGGRLRGVLRFRDKANSCIRRLNPCSIAQKVSERNSLCNFVSGIWITINCVNPIAKTGEYVFDAFSSEPWRLCARYELALLADSPFVRMTRRLDIALELKYAGGFFCPGGADFQRARQVLFRPYS